MINRFRFLPLGAVRPLGWMLSQLEHDLTAGFASCLDSLTERAATDLFSARIESSDRQVAWWDSETRGNWLWGYTMMAGLAGDSAHQARVNELLKKLKQTQDADGYIGIYAESSRYQHDGENGELWAQSRALLTLLAHYELTGDESSLNAVRSAADLTMRQYGVGRSYFRSSGARNDLTGMTHGLCYVDVVEWLYQITHDDRYRDFGTWLYQDFNQMQLPFPNDDMALLNLLDPSRHLSGHAVHTVEHVRALLFAGYMGGFPQGGSAWESALKKLQHYSLPSGAVLGDEGLHGFPSPDIGYEYCTLTELLFSLTSALQKTENAALGDWIESLAFNAAQGARFADGRGLAYLSLDTRTSATQSRPDSYSHLHGRHGRFKYSPTHEDVACCCNPNSIRLLPHYISRMWMQVADRPGLAAATYGACAVTTKIKGVDVTITEETDYPFSDEIRFTINTPHPLDFDLLLRKPAWSKSVTLDGVTAHHENDWLLVSRTWRNGDSFKLTFQPEVEAIPYPTGEYAVRRGALQYVLPAAHELHPVKDYPLEHFHDYEITPVDIEQAYQPFILDGSKAGFGLTFAEDPKVETPNFGHQFPVWLEAQNIRLVPMGCATLRRASFPIKR